MLKKIDPDIIKGYLEDSSNLSGGSADGVFLPENEQEIVEIVAECNAKKLPLTISAGQTGTTGGCIPFGGWLLSTQKLNKIVNVDKAKNIAVVQAGATLEEIEKAAAAEGLLYPPDPTEKKATIGGNVATNASGGRCYRFGSTRDWVRRIKIALPGGFSLNLKRGLIRADLKDEFVLPYANFKIPAYSSPAIKNAAGYFSQKKMDLVDLFIGSEGTLGVIQEVEIGLLPAFTQTFDIIIFLPSEQQAVDLVLEHKKLKDPTINYYEFFDENSLNLLRPTYTNIPREARAAVSIEQEVNDANRKTLLDQWASLIEKFGGAIDDCWLGETEKQKAELTKFRYDIPEHLNDLFRQYHQVKLATDIAVPEDKFREMFAFYQSQLQDAEIFSVKFGHIGDNHLHVNLVAKNDAELKSAQGIVSAFIAKAVSLGGTISAEHGVGKIKHEYLKLMYGESGISEMQRVKKIFDPNFILGRNNIFPK